MAFDVSYIFTAHDKYTAIAKKVAAQNERVKRSVTNAASAFRSKLKPSMTAVNAAALKMKSNFEAVEKRFEGITFASEKIRNAGLGLTAAITLPMALAARSAMKFASDGEETRSKFATVFKSLDTGAEDVADSFAKNFGLAGLTARRLVGDTGDLLTGFGFTQEKALDLSRQVNELAVDLASFTNFSGGTQGASEALTKALLGERESLKSLGVAITEDLVKKKVAILVSQGQKFASLAEAKAVATLAIAVEQSKNAVGDYARTKNSAANVSRRLSEETIKLRERYGKILLPMQVKVNKAIIQMIGWLNRLSPEMKKTILVIGGVAAVMGPLLLIIGSIGLAIPTIVSGLALLKVGLLGLMGPVGIVLALTSAIGVLLVKSRTVKAFFSGIGLGIKESVGPSLTALIAGFKKAGDMLSGMFGSGSPSDQAVTNINEKMQGTINAGRLIGNVLGGALDVFITSLRIVGDLIGQVTAAIANLNFSNFDFGSIFEKARGLSERLGIDKVVNKVLTPATNVTQQPITASPAVATANANATVNGQITVSATEGSRVDSVESDKMFNGAKGNIGLGAAA